MTVGDCSSLVVGRWFWGCGGRSRCSQREICSKSCLTTCASCCKMASCQVLALASRSKYHLVWAICQSKVACQCAKSCGREEALSFESGGGLVGEGVPVGVLVAFML